MKDKNGIEICCENCDEDAQRHCANWNPKNGKEGSKYCVNEYFSPSFKALEARIAELEKKLTETVKLLSERSRECGKLKAYNEVLQRRIREFSMELLDYNMKENKDVLERIKEYEENFDKNTLTQSTESGTFNRAKTRDVSWGEIGLYKDGESHIMDVKMSPKFVKSIIRAVNSEVKILKRELRFTDEELNLIRNAFQDQIRDDKDGWSAEKKIIAKCDELLKERKD